MLSNITRLTCDPINRLDFSWVQLSDDLVVYFLQMYHENTSYREFPLPLLLSLGRCTQRVFEFVWQEKKCDSCAAKIQTAVGTISMRTLTKKGLGNTVCLRFIHKTSSHQMKSFPVHVTLFYVYMSQRIYRRFAMDFSVEELQRIACRQPSTSMCTIFTLTAA